MVSKALLRKRPGPTSATVVAVAALAVTGAYVAGLVPGVSKTLPTFVTILQLTIGLFVLAGLAWAVSFVVS